jgi:hypothetical protein
MSAPLQPFEVDGIAYIPRLVDGLMHRGFFTIKEDIDREEWLLAQIDETENGALSTAELLEAMK